MKSYLIGVVAALSGLIAHPAVGKEKQEGEKDLAVLLDGRVAGAPVECIPRMRPADGRIIEKTAIVFDRGSTIYVNRPTNASGLHAVDSLFMLTNMTQVCRNDTVGTVDDSTGMRWERAGAFGNFVPYTRPKSKSDMAQ